MKNIIIVVLIFLGIVIFASYFGIIKINAPENLFGKADKISSNGFQFVGKVDLLENQQVSSSIRQTSDLKNNKNNKITNITSIITPTAPIAPVAPIAPIASTSTSTAPIEPIASTALIAVAPIVPVTPATQEASSNIINIGISEILVGIDGNADYEFIELYNPNDVVIDLTGYSIKKRNSTGNISTLVSNNTGAGNVAGNFKNKKIMPHKYLLLAQKDGYGLTGSPRPDILYSTNLAYKNNAVTLYNVDGKAIEDISWDEIIKGQSLERISSSWNSGEFKIQTSPNPQNSQSN